MIGWAEPHVIALYVGRPVNTIRTWANTGAIPVACDTNGRIIVHAATTRAYSQTRPTRRRLLTPTP